MEPKVARMALRLSEGEISKVQTIAGLNQCSLSEAVRRLVRGAEIVVKPAVIEADPAHANRYPDKKGCRQVA